MEILIRKAKIKDAVPISKLSNELGYMADISSTKNRLETILQLNDHKVFTAFVNGSIIGWIHGFYTLRIESDAFIEIGGLVVGEKYRRKGIGQLLVDSVMNWAKSKDCKKVRVRCNTLRTDSHTFYEQIGFTLNKEQKIFDKQLNTSILG